jgi:hypothetical protein
MAIHEDVPGLTIRIVNSRGTAPKEYTALSFDSSDSVDEPSHPSTFRYVEAKSGQTFAIKYTFGDAFHKNHRIISNVCMHRELVALWKVEGLMDLEGHLVEGIMDWDGNKSRLSRFRFSQLNIRE